MIKSYNQTLKKPGKYHHHLPGRRRAPRRSYSHVSRRLTQQAARTR
jgi:hypothetical protein